MGKVRQFYVVGRALATEDEPNPQLYRMRIFARDAVLARSKFWYHMKRQHKIRRIQGEIVNTSEIFEKKPSVIRNYGIVLRYLTRTIIVNMYKEYRDTTLCGAVSQMYLELAGRHSAAKESIQIIRTSVVQDKDVKRNQIAQFARGEKFPKTVNIKRPPSRSLGSTFKAVRPTLC